MTCETCKANKVCDHNKYGFENCGNYISVDSVDVVRCRDCKHRREYIHGSVCLPVYGLKQITDLNAHCSYGERKTVTDTNVGGK